MKIAWNRVLLLDIYLHSLHQGFIIQITAYNRPVLWSRDDWKERSKNDSLLKLARSTICCMIHEDEHIIRCSECGRNLIVKDNVNNGVAFLSHLKADHGITYLPQRMTKDKTITNTRQELQKADTSSVSEL